MEFKEILERKIEHYGKTEAAYEFAAEEYSNNLIKEAENKPLTLYGVVPMLRKAHDMLEVDFSKQTQKDQEEMTKIVEMCEAIKDDYWMYKPID